MKIYILRHGETDLNRTDRLSGKIDVRLNDKGRNQAESAGKKLYERGIYIDYIISSPLDRALETAEIVTDIERNNFLIDERLMEIDYGIYEGKSIREMPIDVIDFLMHPSEVKAPPEIESLEHVYERVSTLINEIIEEYDDNDNILLVTHGIAMRSIIGYLKKLSCKEVWSEKEQIENCALYCAEVTNNKNKVYKI